MEYGLFMGGFAAVKKTPTAVGVKTSAPAGEESLCLP